MIHRTGWPPPGGRLSGQEQPFKNDRIRAVQQGRGSHAKNRARSIDPGALQSLSSRVDWLAVNGFRNVANDSLQRTDGKHWAFCTPDGQRNGAKRHDGSLDGEEESSLR